LLSFLLAAGDISGRQQNADRITARGFGPACGEFEGHRSEQQYAGRQWPQAMTGTAGQDSHGLLLFGG
jgi:hypothetical protein